MFIDEILKAINIHPIVIRHFPACLKHQLNYKQQKMCPFEEKTQFFHANSNSLSRPEIHKDSTWNHKNAIIIIQLNR